MTDTTNGWLGKPGVPLNPEKDGWHWLENKYTGDRRANLWLTDLHWGLRSPIHEVGKACIYLGPVLSHDEATALQARVAELEDLIRAVHRHAKNLAGDRTFDQCITALGHIDDLCRAALEGKKDEPGES